MQATLDGLTCRETEEGSTTPDIFKSECQEALSVWEICYHTYCERTEWDRGEKNTNRMRQDRFMRSGRLIYPFPRLSDK